MKPSDRINEILYGGEEQKAVGLKEVIKAIIQYLDEQRETEDSLG
mgnify:FL=1